MRAVLLLALMPLLNCSPTAQAPHDDAADDSSDAAPDGRSSDIPPPVAQGLERWLTGNPDDAEVSPSGPGLFLAGGGADVDAGFVWMREHASGGDVVILRASGSDGYNDYLFDDIGGFDSVETLLVDQRELADDPYVSWVVDHAEAIFIAGGDQSKYLELWTGTAVQQALADAWSRSAMIGGTSAGCAILGQYAFSAENGTVYSSEALEDPYNEYMTLARDFVPYGPTVGIITDTHFGARDRMGRLAGFIARIAEDGWSATPIGLGIDEGTALLVNGDGLARVVGSGSVYAVVPSVSPETCTPEQPLTYRGLTYYRLGHGDEITLPLATTDAAALEMSVAAGVLSPSDPY